MSHKHARGFSFFALLSLAIAAPFAFGDRLAVLAAHLRSLSAVGFWPQVGGWFVIIAIAILPAAMVAGFQFPLLVALRSDVRFPRVAAFPCRAMATSPARSSWIE